MSPQLRNLRNVAFFTLAVLLFVMPVFQYVTTDDDSIICSNSIAVVPLRWLVTSGIASGFAILVVVVAAFIAVSFEIKTSLVIIVALEGLLLLLKAMWSDAMECDPQKSFKIMLCASMMLRWCGLSRIFVWVIHESGLVR